ncbi:MAG: CBS domain-containing protein [Planctomycetes bacterium]|nr:CBS domain-containing protein [Planctomycetota bacterium]
MQKQDIHARRVRDVMATDLVAANPGDSVSDALKLMVENRVSALPVIDAHNRCVGMLSGTDLLQLALQLGGELEALNTSEGLAHELLLEKLEHTGFSDQVVSEVMTHVAVTVQPETTLVTAAGVMIRNRVHRLAVTDTKQVLVGLISSMDIVRAVAESEG